MPLSKTTSPKRWAEMAEELAGVGYWRMDAVDNALAFSPNMIRMVGFGPDEAPTMDAVMQRVHPHDRKTAEKRLKENLSGKSEFNLTRVVWPCGEVRYLESRNACEFDEQGRVVAILGTSIDVTERTHLQEALADSEEHFRKLAEACPDIISRCDLAGRITYISPAVQTMLGYRPLEAIGKTAFDFMHPDDVDRIRSGVMAYLARGHLARPVRMDCRMLHKKGHVVWVESSPRAIVDAATGKVTEVQDIVRDVSEKKRNLLRVA